MSPSAAARTYRSEPSARISVLENGLRIITRSRRETRAAALNLSVLAGSRDEDAQTAGAAHMMEHLFFQGTPRCPTWDDVVGPIVARGGLFNAATEREYMGFFVEAPATALETAIEQLGDVIINARFDESRLESVRGAVIAELRRRANDPGQLARDVFHDLVLTGHPAQHSPGGTSENVLAIELESLSRYRAERFVAGNMVLAVVGRLDHDEVVEQAARTLGTLPAGASLRTVASPPSSRAVHHQLEGGRTSAQIVLGFATPGLHSTDRFALAVAAAILGRAGRRLRRELREGRSLTYAVSARFGALSDVGIFTVATSVDAARCEEALEVIRAELVTLRKHGVTREELAAAQGYLEGRTYLSEERNLAQARRISGQELLGVPLGLDEYVQRINRVTEADVLRVAEQYLDPNRAVTVVVRP